MSIIGIRDSSTRHFSDSVDPSERFDDLKCLTRQNHFLVVVYLSRLLVILFDIKVESPLTLR